MGGFGLKNRGYDEVRGEISVFDSRLLAQYSRCSPQTARSGLQLHS